MSEREPHRPCPTCGDNDTVCVTLVVAIPQNGTLLSVDQDGTECRACHERWSTAEQCAATDDLLCAMGWEPRR